MFSSLYLTLSVEFKITGGDEIDFFYSLTTLKSLIKVNLLPLLRNCNNCLCLVENVI